MNRIRLVLGAALALTFVGGSAYIAYHDRPVMRLQGQGTSLEGGAQPLEGVGQADGLMNASGAVNPQEQPSGTGQVLAGGGEREDGEGEDENEGEEGEDGGVIPTGTTPAPAPAPAPQPSPASAPASAPAPKPAPAPSGYTMTDVRAHASANNCWSAIDGNVYDLTSWISRHPGGQGVIIALCGKDGSAAYDGQHGGQQRPLYYLTLLKIGALR